MPNPYDYLATPNGLLTTPPDSPKILIHARQGKSVGIYCDQPAKVLMVETRDDARHPVHQATPSMISPAKAVDGHATSIDRVLAMAFNDPTLDDDLRQNLAAYEI